MSIFSKTQTARIVKDADGNLTGITEIETDANIFEGVLKALTNPFTGGENVVTGAANIVAMPISGLAVAWGRDKLRAATGFDVFFGLVQ